MTNRRKLVSGKQHRGAAWFDGYRPGLTRAKVSAALVVAGLAVSGMAFAAPTSEENGASTTSVSQPQADLIARGKYLTEMGDCAACHTASGGRKFAGGQYMETPFGPIATPNITPDKQTGIGNYTDDQFYRLFHEGVGRNGRYIYPVMPYPWYTNVTRDDALAIKAYLFSLPPVSAPRKPGHMRFPFNIRAGLAVWDSMFLHEGPLKPDPKASAQVNRGAYIVQGLAHCGECHNGNMLLGNSAISGRLEGGEIEKWYAPNLTKDMQSGIGKYTDAQLVTYLKTGAQANMGVVAGPMAQTVHESLHNLTDEDLQDIVAYLKSRPAQATYKPAVRTGFVGATSEGAQAYLSFCASCHQPDGKGIAGAVPSLVGNGVVTAKGSETMIRVVLGGIEAQGGYAPMPAIGVGMTDAEVASAVNYVRQSWGNAAPPNAGGGKVGDLRKDTHTVLNFTRPGGCPKLAQANVARALDDKSNGIGDALRGVNAANMFQAVSGIIPKLRAVAPGVQQADIVNALTVAYCPVLAEDRTIPDQQKRTQLDQFSNLVYTQLASHDEQ